MNKLLFTLKNYLGDDLVLIANNHKDLEDHLSSNYDWYYFNTTDSIVYITKQAGCESETATLEWVKHI